MESPCSCGGSTTFGPSTRILLSSPGNGHGSFFGFRNSYKYCDSMESYDKGNPQIVFKMIKDLKCALNKTFGGTRATAGVNQRLMEQLCILQEMFEEKKKWRTTTQQKICQLQQDLNKSQREYEQAAEQRIELENILTELQTQTNRMEASALVEIRDRAKRAECLKELTKRSKEVTIEYEDLKDLKARLLQSIHDLEEEHRSDLGDLTSDDTACSDLEDALKKANAHLQELVAERDKLREDKYRLKLLAEKCESDTKRLDEEIERENLSWEQEKKAYEATLIELKVTTAAQVEKSKELDQIHKGLVEEREKVRKEGEDYCHLLQHTKRQKAYLEQLIRKLEEDHHRKRPFASSYDFAPCSEFRKRSCI